MLLGCPVGDEVGVGDDDARGVCVGLDDADGFTRLDQEGLVGLESLEGFDDRVVGLP